MDGVVEYEVMNVKHKMNFSLNHIASRRVAPYLSEA